MSSLRPVPGPQDLRALLLEAVACGRMVSLGATGERDFVEARIESIEEHTVTLALQRPRAPTTGSGAGLVSVWMPTVRLPLVFHTRVWTERGTRLRVVFPAEILPLDRRAALRIEPEQAVEALLAFDLRVLRRPVLSISQTGFAVRLGMSDSPPTPGATVEQLRLDLPAGGSIVASGVLRSCRRTAGLDGEGHIAGIALTDLTDAHEARLRGWLRHARGRQQAVASAPPGNDDTGAHALVHTARGSIRKLPLLRLAAGGAEIGLEDSDSGLLRTGRVAMVELVLANQSVKVNVSKLTDAVSHRGRPMRATVKLWGLPTLIRSWLAGLGSRHSSAPGARGPK